MKRLFYIFPIIFFLYSCDTVTDSNPAENISSVLNFNLFIDNEHYNVFLENKFSNIEMPVQIYLDNAKIPATIEPQGAGSRNFPKWGYNISCKPGYTIAGLNEFNLSIQQYDKTKIRTALTSFIYNELGFNIFSSTHAFVRINNENKGLYVLTERIEDNFFESRNLKVFELIKAVFGAKFTYTELNTLNDNFEKKIPDDKNFNNLAEFIYALDTVKSGNIFSALGKYIDIEQYLNYHCATGIMNNSDGLTNNFYLYKRTSNQPYEIIPWDFDKTFDPAANMDIYSGNKIIEKLLQNDSCKILYKSQIKYILNNIFNEEKLFPIIDSIYLKIKEAYILDPYLEGGLKLENEIQVLKSFIINRREELFEKTK